MLTNTNRTEIARWLSNNDIKFQQNVNMSHCSYLRTGGVAELLIFPATRDQLSILISRMNELSIDFKIVGATSNLLFLDDNTFSILISTQELKSIEFDRARSVISASCGAMIPDVARFALYNSITGFEGLEGIPGTVGGGLVMNAGAYGHDFSLVVVGAELIDMHGNLEYKHAAELNLGHRRSIFRDGVNKYYISRVDFHAIKGDPDFIFRKMELFHAKRHRYQDFIYPNLGSLFSGNVYRALARRDRVFYLYLAAYSFLGYRVKLLGRESPISRRWINKVASKRFNLDFEIQPYSDKTLNCLVNRGQGTQAMLEYIERLNNLTGGEIPIENEVVRQF